MSFLNFYSLVSAGCREACLCIDVEILHLTKTLNENHLVVFQPAGSLRKVYISGANVLFLFVLGLTHVQPSTQRNTYKISSVLYFLFLEKKVDSIKLIDFNRLRGGS